MQLPSDHSYARRAEFGAPLVGSTFTLAPVTGQKFGRRVMVYGRDHTQTVPGPEAGDPGPSA